MRTYFVYIMASRSRTLYVGITNDLPRRVAEHRAATGSSFTAKYRIGRLVYAEQFNSVTAAIEREKQIKGWRRSSKLELIQSLNPGWSDLASDWESADPSRCSG